MSSLASPARLIAVPILANTNSMSATMDVRAVAAKQGYAVILLQPEEYSQFIASPHRIEIDATVTRR